MCMRLVVAPANFKWPGDGIYIGLQVHRAVGHFSAKASVRLVRGAPVHPVTHGSVLAVGLLTAYVAVTG